MSIAPLDSSRPHAKYERLIAAAKDVPAATTIVVHPCDESSLRGVIEATVAGIIKPILVGPSRTSKTPTCVYLANRGVRAANVPLVPLVDPPSALETAKRPLIVGLITDPERLVQIRVNRLRLLQQNTETDYTDMDNVQREIQEARRLYARRKWATIDVTRRSIEETAAAILQMLAVRRDQRLQATE